jgi:antitoxin HigA-1
LDYDAKTTYVLHSHQLVVFVKPPDMKLLQERKRMNTQKLTPVTPGELLLEEFMIPMNLTKYRLAKDIGVLAQRIGQIVAGKRAITADTDLRLCKYFGLSEGYWLHLQNKYDVDLERDRIKDQLDLIVPYALRHVDRSHH